MLVLNDVIVFYELLVFFFVVVLFDSMLLFDSGKVLLKFGLNCVMVGVFDMINVYFDKCIFVVGYIDNVGNLDSNLKLLIVCVEVVWDWLVDVFGIFVIWFVI